MFVCGLSYPACNTYAPYCHLWPARLSNIFPHYLINGTIFAKHLPNMKTCVLIFSKHFPENFFSLRKTERDIVKNTYWSLCQITLFLSYFNESLIFLKDFRKIIKYQISWQSSNGNRVVSCRQIDRRVDITKLIERAYKTHNQKQNMTQIIRQALLLSRSQPQLQFVHLNPLTSNT